MTITSHGYNQTGIDVLTESNESLTGITPQLLQLHLTVLIDGANLRIQLIQCPLCPRLVFYFFQIAMPHRRMKGAGWS